MSTYPGLHFQRKEWPIILAPIVILFVYLYYTFFFVFLTPYPGILFTPDLAGWQVNDSSQPALEVGDVLQQIGSLTFSQYQENRLRIPFAGYDPGEVVSILVEGKEELISLRMPAPTVADRLKRILSTLGFFPFWAAGTVVMIFLRPRDKRWALLLSFMYLIAIWLVVGGVSSWRIGGSRIVLGIAFWLIAPIFIHLHLTVPSPLVAKKSNWLILVLYGFATLFSVLEIAEALPTQTPLIGAFLGISVSIGLLVFRLARRQANPSDRVAARLMFAGIGLAFLPGTMFQVLPGLLGLPSSSVFALSMSLLAIPILPFFYIYAIYKRQLGALEFRTNRFISFYSFILLYPTLFLLLVLSGNRWLTSATDRTIYLLVVSVAFVITTPFLLSRFQSWINRLAYGTEHDPETLVRVFANQIPSALERETLVQLIEGKILPSLLIRQSSLLLIEENTEPLLLYAQNTPDSATILNLEEIDQLKQRGSLYRPPPAEPSDDDWVRLMLLLKVRDEEKGLWLFGKRDPDDFYPRQDIDLLQTLANQIAPVIENIQLYEALQTYAQGLAAEVAARTIELAAEKDRRQAILDSAGEGIFFADSAGTILYVNPTMTQLTGFTTDELMGRSLHFWQRDPSAAKAFAEMETAINRGHKWAGDLVLRRKNGRSYDASLTVAPLLSDSGTIDGFVGVQSDISTLKEVDRLKTNIIANVSHELRTPLTNIRMYLDLLRHGKLDKQAHYFNVLDHETDRLTRLIQDLLDLSKLDSGELTTHLAPTDLWISVRNVVDGCQPKANSKQIEIITEQPQSLPPALADPIQMEQVLTNLVTNAINYTPTGSTVTVQAGIGELDHKEAIWMKVSDNGPGIAAEDLPHLFDRFFRGKDSRNSEVPGTGLGLAICKEIIDRHYGRIDVHSEVGDGSAFTVWLPAIQANGQ